MALQPSSAQARARVDLGKGTAGRGALAYVRASEHVLLSGGGGTPTRPSCNLHRGTDRNDIASYDDRATLRRCSALHTIRDGWPQAHGVSNLPLLHQSEPNTSMKYTRMTALRKGRSVSWVVSKGTSKLPLSTTVSSSARSLLNTSGTEKIEDGVAQCRARRVRACTDSEQAFHGESHRRHLRVSTLPIFVKLVCRQPDERMK
jgi:hypothetical protein